MDLKHSTSEGSISIRNGSKSVHRAKADPAPARRSRAHMFEISWGFVFVNFDCITRIYYFNCSHHTMFAICTLFSTLTTKHIGYVWMDIKTNPRSQKFYRAGTAPAGFEIPGSVTVECMPPLITWCYMWIYECCKGVRWYYD